jgi:hypothetical protein
MLSDVEKLILASDFTQKPHFYDHCGHKGGEYIGTSPYYYNDGKDFKEGWVDVYIFDSSLGQEVCIRYGKEDREYYSPGLVVDFLRRSGNATNPAYKKALEILFYRGYFKYVRNDE